MGLYLELKQTETKTTELCMVSLKRTEEDFGTRLFTIGRFPFECMVSGRDPPSQLKEQGGSSLLRV